MIPVFIAFKNRLDRMAPVLSDPARAQTQTRTVAIVIVHGQVGSFAIVRFVGF